MQELKRITILQEILAKRLTAVTGAQRLGISLRQMRRLIRKFQKQGPAGVPHGNRGRPSPHKTPESIRQRILDLARAQFHDYNDCHLTEKLHAEPYGIPISRSTVRLILRAEGRGSPRKRRAPRHRQRRDRRTRMGELLQADASKHAWLEDRGPMLTLAGYIDDATSTIPWAQFREAEDSVGYFLGLREICLEPGIPLAVYADRHMIFQSPASPTGEQILSGEFPHSQFGRLCEELSIELIAAQSPQAKGRIERLWGTLQDRLVKELREAKACALEEANAVLQSYLPRFNAQFGISPADPASAFLPWPKQYRPVDYFCFKFTRKVANDNTISFDNQKLQIPPRPWRSSFAHCQVDVHQHLDGALQVLYQGRELARFEAKAGDPVRVGDFFPAIPLDLTKKPTEPVPVVPKPRSENIPAPDHPWRRGFAIPSKMKKTKPETVKELPVLPSSGVNSTLS